MKEAGHYYTVYYVSLAVGYENKEAFTNAFFTQLPDEVEELDAAEQAFDFAKNFLVEKIKDDLIPFYEMNFEEIGYQYLDLATIQMGLHTLTGGSSVLERRFRTQLAQDLVSNRSHFGINLHAFGDAYAHSRTNDETMLYDTGLGHATHFDHPDLIAERPDLYLNYVENLYNLLQRSLPIQKKSSGSIKKPQEKSLQEVRSLAQKLLEPMEKIIPTYTHSIRPVVYIKVPPSEEKIIERIREMIIKDMKVNNMEDYAPEKNDPIPWSQFQEKYKEQLNGITLREIQQLARQWTLQSQEFAKQELKRIMKRLQRQLESVLESLSE